STRRARRGRVSWDRSPRPFCASARGRGAVMRRVFANKVWTLERDTSQLLLVVRRSEAPYLRVEEIGVAFRELEEALKAYNRKYFALLIDMRSALQRNDH